jgi:hypothetical protein
MEPVQLYVISMEQMVCLFVMGVAIAGLIISVVAAINELNKPSAEEQRLMQIQLGKVHTDLELTKLTQDYVQRMASEAQQRHSQEREEKKSHP